MLSAALLTLLLAPASSPSDSLRTQVRLDAKRHEVTVIAGPFTIHAMPPGMKHEDMDKMNDHNTPVYRFEWPVEGWLRGFAVELVGADGRPIERRLVHHLIVINFDRRQLLYPSYERTFGIGQETQDLTLPKTIGVPMKPGTRMGFYLSWANETGKDLEGVQFQLRMTYSPANLNPRPVAALPIYMDVNLTVGRGNSFTIAPGRSEKAWEFTPAVSGRLLGVGGHLHDYGVGVRLEDVETGKVLTQIESVRTPDGKLKRIGRKLFGVAGEGLLLKGGRRYRVVGIYDNPTGEPIKGAMAHMVGLFAPENFANWPALDLTDPTLQDDLAFLTEMGGGGGHQHEKREQ
ncbi:MAG TPA: hypothetical protein VGQ73_02455 [Gemmatimonadales bacterium]|nr:hypothetical protein [Gemmatimonadales bacterium]